MELQLPIKTGERPLFKSLEIVETIYRDYKRNGNAYETITSEQIIQWVAQLYTFSEILKNREIKGMRGNSGDLFRTLQSLPLFFTVAQVKAWEVQKEWNNTNFIPYKNTLIEYEISFDTLTPSSLYQVRNKASEAIWEQWLIKTPIKEIIDTILYSVQSLLEWNQHRIEKTNLEQNLLNISHYLGVDQNTSQNWFYFYVLGSENEELWNIYLKENFNKDPVKELISIWEKSLSLKHNSLNSLIYEDSILVELGFYYPVDKKITDWQEYWDELKQFNIPNLNKTLLKQENILELFLREIKTDQSLPLNMFSYLKGLEENIHLISQLKTGKILIYGKHLSGKKSLVHTILKTIGYKGFKINHKQHQDDEIKNKNHELKLADRLLSAFEKSALIIENAEENYDLTTNKDLQLNDSLQFWTVSNINDVNKNILQKFDIVLEMENPPLDQRIALSKLFFKEDSTAIRIAQSLKSPFEIIRLGNLCNIAQNWAWSHVSLLMSNFNSLENLSNRIEMNKLDNTGNVIPLVGYPDLQILLDKLINYYKSPNIYLDMGAKADKGILLVGPPGTGKTHFARNLSKHVNLPIFAPDTSVLASNLENITQLFNELKRQSPCILFLDEIDSLIANPKTSFSVDLEKQKIVNTFLSHIDGIEANDGILIIGTTHRKDNFDPAAIRSGRLSKVVSLSLPNECARKEIWQAHLKNKKLSSSVNISELSLLSVGFSCADIMEASNKAAILAVEDGKKEIELAHLTIACDETFWGYTDNHLIVSEKQKKITAYHEAGHALLAWEHGYNVQRITIRPRQNSLGATHFIGEEGVFNMSMENIKKRIQVMLGGICAEKVMFKQYENGGIGDLKSANKLVFHALSEAGLGNEGPINLGDPLLWSNERKLRIEKEETDIMNMAFNDAELFLTTNKNLLTELAETLLEYREISGETMNHFKNKLLSKEPLLIKKTSDNKNDHVLHQKD